MAVYLGRFCPFHKGHVEVVKTLIKKFGEGRVFLIIGSSTSLDVRTPYSYSKRRDMIHLLYPKLTIIPLPDMGNDDIWLDEISKIEKVQKKRFVFFGGSTTDLEVLSRRFKTEVIIDRTKDNISGTAVRKAIAEQNYDYLRGSVSKKILKYLDIVL